MDKQTSTMRDFARRWLDGYIAIYFGSREAREKYTLGEFLASAIRSLGPESLSQYFSETKIEETK